MSKKLNGNHQAFMLECPGERGSIVRGSRGVMANDTNKYCYFCPL